MWQVVYMELRSYRKSISPGIGTDYRKCSETNGLFKSDPENSFVSPS